MVGIGLQVVEPGRRQGRTQFIYSLVNLLRIMHRSWNNYMLRNKGY
jgi:hypothetical protein